MRKVFQLLPVLAVLVLPGFALAAGKTELTWYGHAAFKITTPNGKVLLLDPWITNPANTHGKQDLANIHKADLILITHGHFDHVGNSVEIAKRTGAQLVSSYDLGRSLVLYDGFPKGQVGMATQGNIGGELNLLDGEVKIAFTPAVHSSSVIPPDGKSEHYGGTPVGFVIMIKHGPTIYDTGDTDVFSDMSLIPEFAKIDVMLACIGDHFTMGPKRAAMAVKLVKPKMVIPMHYGTFPVLTGTPTAFARSLRQQHVRVRLRVMKVDETLKL